LAEATDRINDHQLVRMSDIVELSLPENGCVAILATLYKPHTPVVEASQGVMLAEILADAGHAVVAFDPIATESAKQKRRRTRCVSPNPAQDAINLADVVVATTPSPDNVARYALSLRQDDRARVVVDPWSVVSDSVKSALATLSLDDRHACGTANPNVGPSPGYFTSNKFICLRRSRVFTTLNPIAHPISTPLPTCCVKEYWNRRPCKYSPLSQGSRSARVF
jgi:hypothetical protein